MREGFAETREGSPTSPAAWLKIIALLTKIVEAEEPDQRRHPWRTARTDLLDGHDDAVTARRRLSPWATSWTAGVGNTPLARCDKR